MSSLYECSFGLFQTPTEEVVPSSRAKSGHFYLTLPNPVQGGSYTCMMPDTYESCQKEATFGVDEVEVRTTLLEAENRELKADNRELNKTLQHVVRVTDFLFTRRLM